MTETEARDFQNTLSVLCRKHGVWLKSSFVKFDNPQPDSSYTTIIELSIKVNNKPEESQILSE